MSIRRALRDIAVGMFSEAIEPVEMVLVNRRLRRISSSDADVAALSDDDLLAFLAADGARAKELDEKLQKLTAVLSVAVTVGGLVGQTLLGGVTESWLKTAIAITFLVAELYLVVGVVVGFDGLRPRPRYGYGPGFLRLMAAAGKAKKDELVRAANGSLRDNMIRANQASAAASAIRNGILVFAFAVVLGLWGAERRPSPISTGAAAVVQPDAGPSVRERPPRVVDPHSVSPRVISPALPSPHPSPVLATPAVAATRAPHR
jgi:hypothetical protein